MKNRRTVFISIFWIILGSFLIYLQFSRQLDSYWTGLGTALFIVGVSQIARHIRYRTDKKYKEDVDIQNNDERNRFISGRAWAWAGYLYVIVICVAIIVLQIIGLKELSHTLSLTVCALLILYWGCYIYLSKKY